MISKSNCDALQRRQHYDATWILNSRIPFPLFQTLREQQKDFKWRCFPFEIKTVLDQNLPGYYGDRWPNKQEELSLLHLRRDLGHFVRLKRSKRRPSTCWCWPFLTGLQATRNYCWWKTDFKQNLNSSSLSDRRASFELEFHFDLMEWYCDGQTWSRSRTNLQRQ